MFAYMKSNWVECYSAAKSALQIKDKALVYTMDPSVWGEKPYDLASIAAWHMGLKEEAGELLEKAIELAPNDQRLFNNRKLMAGDFKQFDQIKSHADTTGST